MVDDRCDHGLRGKDCQSSFNGSAAQCSLKFFGHTSEEGCTVMATSDRPSWDDYFLEIARAVARRGDCTRRQVGCVLVDADHRIIGTGYNGAEPGGPSCLAGQCPRGRKTQEELKSGTGSYNDCVAIHAEANALLFARASCKGATAYVSSEVCPDCAKLLRGAGVERRAYR